jgi:hypothetical protein
MLVAKLYVSGERACTEIFLTCDEGCTGSCSFSEYECGQLYLAVFSRWREIKDQ